VPDNSSRHDWERPGAFDVAAGVHRIPLPLPNDGLRAVNVYAIEDGPRLVLVDSGWALESSRRQLEAALAEIGHDLGDIDRFLVTHVHRDHYTQALVVRRLLGTRVALGVGEAPVLAEIQSSTGLFAPRMLARIRAGGAAEVADRLARVAGSAPVAKPEEWEDPDEWLSGGTQIGLATRTLRAVATPGHTRGHLVFHDQAAGLLFAGDHVLPHITPSIGFEPYPAEQPLADYLASLDVVLALADAVLLAAHGPVQPSVHDRAAELIDHHRKRLDEMLAVVGPGVSTAAEVAGQVTWTSRGRPLADLDVFNQMLAVNETIAHLDVLVQRGALQVTEVDGVRHYER
jgi:glyoxylase-like metal-dependent hydrolase (beta-lactamase superfamily II)